MDFIYAGGVLIKKEKKEGGFSLVDGQVWCGEKCPPFVVFVCDFVMLFLEFR